MFQRFKTLTAVSLIALMSQSSPIFAGLDEPTDTAQVRVASKFTSSEARCSVLRSYYGENPDNPDLGIFDHFKEWHTQDVEVLRNLIQIPENQTRLNRFNAAMNRAFQEGTMNYAKLGLGYYLYSFVVDMEIGLTEDEMRAIEKYKTEDKANQIATYIETGTFPSENPDFLSSIPVMRDITHHCLHEGIRCLPLLSQGDLSTFRTLNESFGLRTPILELPLKRASYDGVQDAQPGDVYVHDVFGHMALYESPDPFSVTEVRNLFDLYRTFNDIVRGIPDDLQRFKSDYFLYELGHESQFKFKRPESEENSEGIPMETNIFLDAKNFDAVCDKITQDKIKEFSQLIQEHEAGDTQFVPGSYLPQFINPETGKLYSLEGLVKAYDLDKTKPISIRSLRESGKFKLPLKYHEKDLGTHDILTLNLSPIPFELPADIEDTPENRNDRINEGVLEQIVNSFATSGSLVIPGFGLYTYNILLEIQGYLQSMGLDFHVWDGDKINIDGLTRFHQDVLETFKREVGDKFKAQA